jgi:hypothetical protein
MRLILPATVLLILTTPDLSGALSGAVSLGTDVKSASAANAAEERSSVIAAPGIKALVNCQGGVNGPDGFQANWCCLSLNAISGQNMCSCCTVQACGVALGGVATSNCQGDDPNDICEVSIVMDKKRLDTNVPGHLLSTGHLLSRGFPDAKDGRHRLFSQPTYLLSIFPIIVVLML